MKHIAIMPYFDLMISSRSVYNFTIWNVVFIICYLCLPVVLNLELPIASWSSHTVSKAATSP